MSKDDRQANQPGTGGGGIFLFHFPGQVKHKH